MIRPPILEIFQDKIAVFAAHAAVQKNADTAYPYVQESNFFWLTGIKEQGWQLIIDGFAGRVWLVAPTIADQHQLFDGSLAHDEARRISGIETIITAAEAEELLKTLAGQHDQVYTLAGHPHADHFDFIENPAPLALYAHLKTLFQTVQDCRHLLAKQRAIKHSDEVLAIQEAVDVTIDAFSSVHDSLSALHSEYEIEAEFNYRFTRAGTDGHAYDPIIAGGANACTLHYGKNEAGLPDNGLVLLDVGAQVNGYAADITRTYAVGTPTDRQVAVHAAVETAHHEIIALLGPDVSVRAYHEEVDVIMRRALDSLGLLKSDDDYRKYFPHAISHGLGVDVHDALGKPEVFKPGMVLTVEPGIYIPEEGIGVRIEDDILITESGRTNLSAALPTSL